MDYDRSNKLLNNIFLILYLVFIILYIIFFDVNYKTSNILKTYEINKDNSILKKTSFTSVEYKDKKFNIPDNYSYEINNGIIIYNNYSWVGDIQIIDYSYDDILKYSDSFINRIKDYNYNIKNVEKIVLNNYELLVFDIDESMNNHVLVYTKLDNYKSFAIEIICIEENDYKSVIIKLIDIIKTSSKVVKDNINNSF